MQSHNKLKRMIQVKDKGSDPVYLILLDQIWPNWSNSWEELNTSNPKPVVIPQLEAPPSLTVQMQQWKCT